MSRSARLIYIIVTLIGAVFVLIYRGAGWAFIRGHVGDFLVVQFIYMIARLWLADRWRYLLAGAILLLCIVVEIIKFFTSDSIPRTFFAEMTLGSTFDPLDMIAFILGLMTVLLIERLVSHYQQTVPLR
ncbi:MAG: DUF2809 domain-containing protein [Chloroflexi bacterium]|nr:DUF2809 domain-containing protein [Chloroflexota bacterium]